MARLRKIRHEKFAVEYILTGGNAAEAYRRTWSAFADGSRPPPIYPDQRGYCTLKQPGVRARIEELRDIMAKKSDITLDKVLTDVEVAIQMAKGLQKPGDVINGAMSQAKLVGLLRDRIETGGVGDFDAMENVSDILQKVADEVSPQAAMILAKAFGLEKVEEIPDEEAPADLVSRKPPSDSVN